ncbi:hypothetical protein AMTR_s00071p00189860 [Amborella trichopoda]|uniref:DUF1264 domain-containing protein n=2 Tax=Amborella trichopoda TaxID=13333 RepID=U5DF36_AMBTC|nr:hypothetical protein AMTR_s00071p00189860 [Amborella trichopoda]
MARQVQAHHYCSHPSEDMRQCLIYDSPDADARLIGVEYIISESLFLTLPDQEKKLWHSHEYEVKSGTLFMPGVPGPLQHREMEKLCKSYGKAIHFWQIDKGDSLPLGPPSLMYALTTDGQLDTQLARGRYLTHPSPCYPFVHLLIHGMYFFRPGQARSRAGIGLGSGLSNLANPSGFSWYMARKNSPCYGT